MNSFASACGARDAWPCREEREKRRVNNPDANAPQPLASAGVYTERFTRGDSPLANS